MAETTLILTKGIRAEFQLALLDESGTPVAAFTGSDTLTVQIWGGGDGAALATPTATWISAPAGTILLVFTAANLSALEVQPYPVRVTVTSGASTYLAWQGWIDVKPAPASGTEPTTYSTFRDMLDYSGEWLKRLAMGSTYSGFARERHRARSTLDDWILAHPIRDNRGRWALDVYSSQGPGPGPDPTIKGYLDDDYLIVTDKVREICSRLAIAFVCADQNDDEYRSRAAAQYRHAVSLALGYVAQIDTDADGIAEIQIPLGTISMRNN